MDNAATYDILESRLRALAQEIDFPATPNLAARVRARLEAQPRPVRERRETPVFGWRSLAFAGAAVIVAFGLVLAFSPATREAVADFLGIGGVRVEYGEGEGTRPPIAEDIFLGSPTTLAKASQRVDFEIGIPSDLGEPDEVYTLATPPGGSVSLVYAPRAGLPRARETRVGAVLTEFQAQIDREFVSKKLAGAGVDIDLVSVDGAEGYWIEGEHAVIYRDAEGEFREDTARLAGNTLIWVEAGVTYRLESALDKEEALRIARSVS